MASYSFNITDDGNGNFSVAAFRNPSTPASGGTSLTVPHVENNDSSPAISTTKILGVAVEVLKRVAQNDRSVNG